VTLDEAKQFISRVMEADDLEGLVSLYVFGSVAEGRAHEDSDLDVGVLLDRRIYADESSRFQKRLLLSATLSRIGGPDADVVILNDAPPLLGRAIVTRGNRIICHDEELDHAYVRDIQLMAADIEPWLQRMWRIKLEAMAQR
jgi:predicted nucleotidyltransferase